jgi:hypothetical protein
MEGSRLAQIYALWNGTQFIPTGNSGGFLTKWQVDVWVLAHIGVSTAVILRFRVGTVPIIFGGLVLFGWLFCVVAWSLWLEVLISSAVYGLENCGGNT